MRKALPILESASTLDAGPGDALVDFVLQHAHVRTNVCTRQAGMNYTLPQRTVPDYNVIFVTRGKVVWSIDSQDVPLCPGRMALVPPGVAHQAWSITRQSELFSYHAAVTLPGGNDVFELLAPPVQLDVPRHSRLDSYLRGANAEFARDDPRQRLVMLRHWVPLVFLELIRHTAGCGLLSYRGGDPLVVEVLEELSRRVAEPTTLEDLSLWSGYSPQHLNRVFRRVLGMTPLQHLARMRMQRAAALLAEGRLTIRAVAQSVGFDDPYYFSRAFRQYAGRSPSQYRTDAGSDFPS